MSVTNLSGVCGCCGQPVSRTRRWCSDHCRRVANYSRPCLDCGKPLNVSDGNGPNANTRCVKCSAAARRIWTRETVIDAMQRWATEHGKPPSATDWNASMARRPRGESYPATNSVREVFGSWSAGLIAAGFAPGRAGRPRKRELERAAA